MSTFLITTLIQHTNDYRSLHSAPVEIGDDAWIGCNSIVLKGVKIGRGGYCCRRQRSNEKYTTIYFGSRKSGKSSKKFKI